MAATIQSVASEVPLSSGGSPGGSTWDIAFTISGNLLVVFLLRSTASYSVSSVTWNGVALTLLSGPLSVSGALDVWYLVSPTAGTHTLHVAITGTSGDGTLGGMIAASVNAANTSTPFLDYQQHNYSSPGSASSDSITSTTVPGGLLLDVFQGGTDMTVGRTGTTRTDETGALVDTPNNWFIQLTDCAPSGVSETTGWSWSGGSSPFEEWKHQTVSINPAAAAGGTPFFTQLGYQRFRP